MSCSGFVLAGGGSRRMGRDKALLPLGSASMVEQIAAAVRSAAGNVTIIGPVERYAHLGLPVVPDKVENCGPLGGIYTALALTGADWNLVVACDMPHLTAAFLKQLIEAAEATDANCLVPETGGKLDPLCAVYHARVLRAAESAIDRKLLKMHDFISTLHASRWPVPDPRPLQNINTPSEWLAR